MDILLLFSLFLLGENDLWFVTSWSMTGDLADIKCDYTLSGELDAKELRAYSSQVIETPERSTQGRNQGK